MFKNKLGEDSPTPKFIHLKIWCRDGVESLTTLEEGELKVPIDSCINTFQKNFKKISKLKLPNLDPEQFTPKLQLEMWIQFRKSERQICCLRAICIKKRASNGDCDEIFLRNSSYKCCDLGLVCDF